MSDRAYPTHFVLGRGVLSNLVPGTVSFSLAPMHIHCRDQPMVRKCQIKRIKSFLIRI